VAPRTSGRDRRSRAGSRRSWSGMVARGSLLLSLVGWVLWGWLIQG
jgi:hypothetical protein